MELLQALGVDGTILFQFLIAAVSFIFLGNIVFPAFHKAHLERLHRTKGQQDLTVETNKKIELLTEEYKNLLSQQKAEVDQRFALAKKQLEQELQTLQQRMAHEMEQAEDHQRQELQKRQAGFTEHQERWTQEITEAIYNKLIS